MKTIARVATAAVLAVALVAIGWTARGPGIFGRSEESGPSPRSSASLLVEPKALGRLEPAGEVIDVGAVMGDRLVKLTAKEGDTVKEGAPLVYLDSHALRKLEVEATASELDQAKARLKAELKLAEARIASAQLALKQAQTRKLALEAEALKIPVLERNWQLAKKNRERLVGLSGQVVSEQERESQDLAVEKAKAEWDAAKKALEQDQRSVELGLQAAQAGLDAALAGEQVSLSSIPQQSLEKKLELAQAQWERAVLHAPSDGTILKVFLRPGELVGTTPILQMADLDEMVVIAQVYETDIKRIHPGQKAVIGSKSFQSPYDEQGLEGKVIRIGSIISQPTLKDLNPLAPADRRAVDVRIQLGKEAGKQAKNFVHMQVDVAFPAAGP